MGTNMSFASGLTVMTYVFAVPGQLFILGVTVMVALTGLSLLFIAVNEGTLPVPDPVKPIVVFELDHVKLTPPGVPLRLFIGIIAPSSTVISETEFAVPTGFTVTVNVAVSVAHCPGVVVNV